VVASPSYPAERGRPESPEDLARHTCLIYAGTQQPRQWRFRSGKQWLSVRGDGPLHSDNGDTIAAAAAAGLGIARLPTFAVAQYLEKRQVDRVLTNYSLADAGLYLVRPPGTLVPAKVRSFFDAMAERFSGEPDWDACAMRAAKLLAAGGRPAANDEEPAAKRA
jgi:DNA-binding transcriptional LysR family regulator